MTSKHVSIFLAMVLSACASAAGQGINFIEEFDSYADQAAFEAVWVPVGGDCASLLLNQEATRQRTAPNSVKHNRATWQSNTASLLPAIQAVNPAGTAVNGTDDNPLYLEYHIDLQGTQAAPGPSWQAEGYVELNDGVDRAEVTPDPDPNRLFNSIGAGFYPSWFVPPTWVSGFFGVYRMVSYDGKTWYEAGGIAPGTGDEMNQGPRWNLVRVIIKSTTYDLHLEAINFDPDKIYNRTGIPRQYTGGFKAVSLGPCYTHPTWGDAQAKATWIDNLYITGGVIETTGPSCNTPRADLNGDGSVDGADLGVFGGCFNGSGNPITCGAPCADLDEDGDVDGSDFGMFGGCFNGTGNPPNC